MVQHAPDQLPKNRITLKAAAQLLDVSRRTIDRWRAEGRFQTWKVGGRVYTTRDAMNAVVEASSPTTRRITDAEARRIMQEALR